MPGMRRLKVSWPSRMMKNVQATALPRQHTPRAAFLAVGSLMVAFTIGMADHGAHHAKEVDEQGLTVAGERVALVGLHHLLGEETHA